MYVVHFQKMAGMGTTSKLGDFEASPLLKWAGSKRKLLPHLERFWQSGFDRYVEPFAGSACLFFSLQPKQALLNDLNYHVIGTYRSVRNHARTIHEIASSLPRTADFYYKLRPLALEIKDPILKAAFFVYLNRNCFNGLFRTNQRGQFNVPFSDNRTGALPTLDVFENAAKLLRRTRLSSDDFEVFLAQNVRKGDFVYLDPPYAIENERIFTQYGPTTFGISDLYRLKSAVSHLDRIGAKFVLSYAESPTARSLFSNWFIDGVSVARQIASFASNRRTVKELIVTNINE